MAGSALFLGLILESIWLSSLFWNEERQKERRVLAKSIFWAHNFECEHQRNRPPVVVLIRMFFTKTAFRCYAYTASVFYPC